MAKTVACGIFIVKKDNSLLVCHPTRHKPDFWSIPKGKLEVGESLIDCAIRETYEESNVDLSNKSKFFTIHQLPPVNYGHKKKILHPYLYWETIDSDFDWESFEIKCNSNVPEDRGGFPEMDAYKWIPIEEARTILHDTQVACLDKILEITNGKRYIMEVQTY